VIGPTAAKWAAVFTIPMKSSTCSEAAYRSPPQKTTDWRPSWKKDRFRKETHHRFRISCSRCLTSASRTEWKDLQIDLKGLIMTRQPIPGSSSNRNVQRLALSILITREVLPATPLDDQRPGYSKPFNKATLLGKRHSASSIPCIRNPSHQTSSQRPVYGEDRCSQ